jgi:hypothetical protein
MLRRVRAETGLLKSLTSHRRVFGGSGRFILYRRIVSLMLELPVVSLRKAESASVRDLQLQGSRARESNADRESLVTSNMAFEKWMHTGPYHDQRIPSSLR